MIYLDKSDKKSKFHYINGAGIKCILQNKEKLSDKLIIGDKVIRVSDGKTYNSMADFVKENPNAAVTHDMSTTKGYLAVRINMTQITKEELIKRIQEQRKVTKEMYHLKYTPDCLAYYENENLATVLLETPVTTNIKQYAKRCWALARALNGLTNKQMKESGDVYTIYDNLQRDLPLFVLKDDTIIFSETSDHEKDSKKKEEAQLPEFNGHPQSMDELYKRLEAVGKAWHAIHDKVDEKSGEITPAKMSVRDTLDLLEHYVDFYHLYDPKNDDGQSDLSELPIYTMNYDRNIYEIADNIVKKMLQAINRSITSDKQRKDMITTLEADRAIKKHALTRTVHPELVSMGNGVFDLKKREFREYDLDHDFFISKTNISYNPLATKEPIFEINMGNGKVVKWTLSHDWFEPVATDTSGHLDEKKLRLLYQGLFLSLVNAFNTREVLFCVNDGQSGTSKSTYLELCESMVGKGNFAVVDITKWSDPAALQAARGKSLLVGDDYDANIPIKDFSSFKNLASNGAVTTHQYFHNPYSAPLYIFPIQVSNGMPRFRNIDDAILQRIRVIRFDHYFNTDNPRLRIVKDDFINRKSLLEYLAYKVLHMFTFEESMSIIETDECKQEIRSVASEQDSLQAFIDDQLQRFKSRRVPGSFMYVYYYNSCIANGFTENQILTQKMFVKQFQLKQHDWTYIPRNARVRDAFNSEDFDAFEGVLSQVPVPKQRKFKTGQETEDQITTFNVDRYRGTVFENKKNPSLADVEEKAKKDGEEMRQKIAEGKYNHDDLVKDVDESDKKFNIFVAANSPYKTHASVPISQVKNTDNDPKDPEQTKLDL